MKKLYQTTYIFCNSLSSLLFIISIPTYWHQDESLRCSELAETYYLFKQHIYIAANLAITLQAFSHIADDN